MDKEKEKELKALNRILHDIKNTNIDDIIDNGVEISYSQWGVINSVKRLNSDVHILEVREMLISLLRGAGFQDNAINQIIKDESEEDKAYPVL